MRVAETSKCCDNALRAGGEHGAMTDVCEDRKLVLSRISHAFLFRRIRALRRACAGPVSLDRLAPATQPPDSMPESNAGQTQSGNDPDIRSGGIIAEQQSPAATIEMMLHVNRVVIAPAWVARPCPATTRRDRA